MEAAYVEKAVNVRLELTAVENMPEDMSGPPMLRMAKWQLRTKHLAKKYKVGGTLVFLSPFPSSVDAIDFESEAVLGMASGIGVLGKDSALAFIKIVGSDWVASRIGIHEIGHLLGAWHIHNGIMAPYADANQYASEYSLQTIQQIQEYASHLPD